MTIDFGSIKNYNSDRGFGFIGRTFLNPNEKVFFHIKKIKKKHPELAKKLDSSENFETISFWYEIKITAKGKQVNKLWLSTENISSSYTQELCGLKQEVESIWKNLDSPKPSWLDLVTIDLVGVDRKHELSIERDNLESQLKKAEEEQQKKAETLRQDEIGRIAKEHRKTLLEADELQQLLTEMRPKKFKRSKELSEYIVKYQLGYKYPNISGIVRMREAGREWNFHGGFPPDIYKIICGELGLGNQGTDARAVNFTPFKSIYRTN